MKKPRKLVHGVGINDVPRSSMPDHPNHRVYKAWANMLERCYSAKLHQRYPSYIGCTVAPEWHQFSVFRDWAIINGWAQGLHLDKDLLIPGNRVYGPTACTFVNHRINSLLIDRAAVRGEWPIGVNWHHGKFVAHCGNGTGKSVHLGVFATALAAHRAWQSKKFSAILDAIDDCSTAVGYALLERVAALCADVAAGKETVRL